MPDNELEIIKIQLFNGLDQMKKFLEEAESKRSGIHMGIKLTKEKLPKEHVDHFRQSFGGLAEMCYQAKVTANMLETLLNEIEEKE